MNSYVCFNCGFYTTIKDRFINCPICNSNFTELFGKENKTFLNLNGKERIKWIEKKIGHSIPSDLNSIRENYKLQKSGEIQTQSKIQQSIEFNAKMAHGKAILEEQSRVPKCPTCGSSNISKIGAINRMVSTGLFGLASNKIGKNHKCNNCGTTW